MDFQIFNNSDALVDNAKIDGKLLSTIWSDIISSSSTGSEIGIALRFTGVNLNLEEITEVMGMQPTKIIERGDQSTEWAYIAFTNDDVLNLRNKIIEFANKMAKKEEAINMLMQKYKDSMLLSLTIIGNPFNNASQFPIPPEFIAFAQKINTYIWFDTNFANY